MSLLTFDRSNRRRSFANRAPRWPFALNKDSPQASGLKKLFVADEVGGFRELVTGELETANTSDGPRVIPSVNAIGTGFNDNSQNVQFPTQPVLTGVEEFSIHAIVDLVSSSNSSWICGQYETEAFAQVQLFYDSSTNEWRTRLDTSGADGRAVFSFGSPVLNQVTFLDIVWGTDDVLRAYENGIEQGSDNTASGVSRDDTTEPFHIGFKPLGTATQSFNGAILQIGLYDRARSASEIWASYAPSTRWDLYYELGRVSYLFLPSAVDTFDTALLGSSSPRWDRKVRVY